jgi:hypothetical protein
MRDEVTAVRTLVPQRNLEAYALLFEIENSLRELMLQSLSQVAGERWYKERLPEDVLAKYREGSNYERRAKWAESRVRYHPAYYLDFTDLKKVMEKKENWSDVFAPVFSRKDILSGILSAVEVVRNKVAHNRTLTGTELELVRTARETIRNSVGGGRFAELVEASTRFPDVHGGLVRLLELLAMARECCRAAKAVPLADELRDFGNTWWLDSDCLGIEVCGIRKLLATLDEYDKLPKGRGTGHVIESWMTRRLLDQQFQTCIQTIEGVEEVLRQ